MGHGWRVALGAVLLSGVAFFALTLLGIRERIIDALPASLRHAIAVGIGLFVALLGFTAAGIVERPPGRRHPPPRRRDPRADAGRLRSGSS
jgi:AGZA family xanthine/uracil permease-like MFS transporter